MTRRRDVPLTWAGDSSPLQAENVEPGQERTMVAVHSWSGRVFTRRTPAGSHQDGQVTTYARPVTSQGRAELRSHQPTSGTDESCGAQFKGGNAIQSMLMKH